MKNLALLALLVIGSLAAFGCGKNEAELTADDKKSMDKLFREGIKNTPDPGYKAPASTAGGDKGGKVINAPTD